MNFDSFAADRRTVDAVARNLEIIGEAAKNLPDEILGGSDVPWKKVRRFRDKIAHHYFDINLERVWSIIEADIALLEETVRGLLAKQLEIEGLD